MKNNNNNNNTAEEEEEEEKKRGNFSQGNFVMIKSCVCVCVKSAQQTIENDEEDWKTRIRQ